MIPAVDNFDLYQYINQTFLIDNLDPFKNQSFNKLCLLTSLGVDQQDKNFSKNPDIQKSFKLKAIFANVRRNLFAFKDSQNPLISTFNFIFFMTFFKEVRILLKVKSEDILNDNKSNIIKFFSYIDEAFQEKNDSVDEILKCLTLLVEQKDGKDPQKYINELSKIPKDKLGVHGKKFLEYVLNKKKIIKSGSSLNYEKIIQQCQQITQPFNTDKKKIINLFGDKGFGNRVQAKQKIQRDILKKSKQFLKAIKDGVKDIRIFQTNIQIRTQAFNEQILGKNPFPYQTPNGEKISSVDQFGLQSAWYCLAQFAELEQQLNKNDKYSKKWKYLEPEQRDEEFNPNDIMNLSISGKIIQILFSENTIFHDQNMVRMGKIFHITFFMFQSLEPVFKINIRKSEGENISQLYEIIEGLVVDFFLDALISIVISLVNKENQYIKYASPSKVLYLAKDIKNLRDFIARISTEKRDPYQKLASQIKQRMGSINAAFVFSSWKLYQIFFKKYWSVEQCNSFVLELYKVFMDKEYAYDLQSSDKNTSNLIFKKLSEYLGDYCIEQKNFFQAKRFYENAGLYWKQIQSINFILDNYLKQQNFKSLVQIQHLIKTLALFGLFQDARKWCYKYLDVLDEDSNSDLIALLEQISDYQLIENTLIREQISKLKVKKQIITVDQSTFNKLQKELAKQDWLNGL